MRTPNPAFAGRYEERRIIDQQLDAAGGRRGGALVLEGLAGAGKSKLIEYAAGEAARRGMPALLGIADEGQEGAPYGLFLDVFRRHVRALGGEQPAWLDPRSPWTDLVAFRPASGLQGPQHAFNEIHRALKRLGGPVLLALEDLHWADGASLDMLEWLLREIEPQPCFVLASWRSEELTRQPERGAQLHRLLRRPAVRHVRLGGLSLADTRELVEATLGSEQDHGFLVRQLHRRTEGNPLFLEELLHCIRHENGGPDAALPVSFRDAVRARLRGLSREDVRLLELASVIGARFDIPTLITLSRRTESGVLDALTRLRDHQLIRESRERGEYEFWHALTRDALYEALLVPDRKALHRRISQRWVVATRSGTRQDSDLAYHLEKAGETADAARHYASAAERAAALCAFGEAFAHSERAFAFSVEARGQKALQASRYARMAGDIGAALAYCDRAEKIFGDESDTLKRAEVLLHKSDLHWLKGDGPRAGELLRTVAELRTGAHARSDAPAWAWLHAREAQRAAVESRWSDTLGPADAAIAMSRRLELPAIEAHAKITRSMAQAALEGLEAAVSTLRSGRSLAHQHGVIEEICRSYVAEIDLRTHAGDFIGACQAASEGVERARTAGAPVILYPTLAASAVELLWKTGQWAEALGRIAETERLVNEQPSDLIRCHFRVVLATIAIARERYADAQRWVTDAVKLGETIQEAQWAAPTHRVAAQLALATAKPRVALRTIIVALQRFPTLEGSDAAELVALAREAIYRCRDNGDDEFESGAEAELQRRVCTPGGAADYYLGIAAGFLAMSAQGFVAAADAFQHAATLAMGRGCPADEAHARLAAAIALQNHGTAGGKAAAVRERGKAHALLARMPGRGNQGHGALVALSVREREVARLVADGLANKQVAARLFISDRTVAVHVSRIFEKLGVDSRHRLAALVAKTGGG